MANEQKDFKHIVRIMNTDLDGAKPIGHALKKIKGVSFMLSNAVCRLTNVPRTKTTGHLSGADIEKLNNALSRPRSVKVPAWMFNRRKDPETGEDNHLILGDLQFATENDVKMLKKMKSYRGSRHMAGLPSRGQRTKSNFRKTKSRGKGGLGVAKSKAGKK